jgi:predicted phage terminase large subunit-like protein
MTTPAPLTPEQATALFKNLGKMSSAEKLEALELLDKAQEHQQKNLARTDMLEFAKRVYPGFKVGPHHRKLAKIFSEVIAGTKKRVIINIAPRMGKSEFSSYLFPAFFLGQFPQKKIIMGTHTAGLSEDFGRRVRNLLADEEYHALFDKTLVADDQKAAGKWSTSAGGQYYAAGVGGALAGRGADLFVIDDPHSEQDVKANSRLAFDTAWSWFQTGPLQRLMPGGAIIIVMCMTGDTPVRMADGTERPLRDIRVGDEVATFDKGILSSAPVTNWRSSGVDAVYQIQTRSGRILRANERHPFLVLNKGILEWTRLKHLKAGDLLVSLKAVNDRPERKQNPAYATPAKPPPHTTASTPTPQDIQSGTMESGKGLPAGVEHQSKQKGCARAATTSKQTQNAQSLRQKQTVRGGSNTGTGLLLSSTISWLKNAATSVTCAASRLLTRIQERTGTQSSASTITMTPEQFEAFCATIAILRSGMEKPQMYLNALQDTSDFTADEIVSIAFDGSEEVFDVEVARTENFIANGFVSHNTRWGKLDLTGRLIDYQAKNPDAEPWEIVELPAILHENMPNEKSLWPEQWPLATLKATKASLDPQYWNAQYMQQPTSNNAAIISRKSWRVWTGDEPPRCDYLIQSWDTAFETSNTADYSACTTWGVFYNEEERDQAQIILLDAFKDRMAFPELKTIALKHYREWEPDAFIVEKKAAGAPLIQELRAMGIPVDETNPSRGNDKIVRLNAVADLFASGMVWAPDTRWAREVIEEVASFPNGENDDYVDTTSQALLRFRQGGFISLDTDEKDEQRYFKQRRAAYY